MAAACRGAHEFSRRRGGARLRRALEGTMITSMTGFGRAAGALSERFFVAVTAKSVNHRFLEVSVRLPEFFGKLDVSVRVTRTQQPEYNVRINAQRAGTIVPQLRSLSEELGLGSTFAGSDLMRVPDLLQVEPVESEIRDEEREALATIVRDAF